MTIGRLIEGRSPDVVSCTSQTSVRQAISMLAERRIGALPVLEGAQVVGIFSERDVLYQLHSHGPDMLDRSVGDVMTTPAVTVTTDTEVLSALGLMTKRRIRHLPVVHDGVIIGFISIGDLVKYRIERIESEAEAMRSYIQEA
jgi:CBS domain-containing protein